MGRRFTFAALTLRLPLAVALAAVASCAVADPPRVPDDASQDAPLFTGVADTVEVTSDRPAPLDAVPVFTTVHDVSEELAHVSTVSDVIEAGAGVNVRRYGGLGSYSTASIRASSPGQVDVYLDGIPLNSAQWGVVNLADIPLGSLERIEIYRGGSPVGLGAGGIGGAVNLITQRGGAGSSIVSVSGGSFGTSRLGIVRSGTCAGGDYAITFHELQSEGDFEYLDRHGTPENEEDDETVERQNNDFRESDVMFRLASVPLAGWKVELSNEAFNKRSGVPGVENVHIKSVHYRLFRNAARVALTSPRMLGDSLSLKATAFHVFRRDRFYNPEDEVGFDRWDSDDRSWTYGANLLARYDWHAAWQSLSLFAQSSRDRYIPESSNPPVGVGFTRKRSEYTLSAEDHLFVPGASLELVAGLRYRESADNYAGPPPFGAPPEPLEEPHRSYFCGPTFGARWRIHPNATVRANRALYARFPCMVELFGSSGYIEGNTELEPEEGTTTDVGLTVGLGNAREGRTLLEAVVFWAEREDLILFLQNSQRTVKAFNLEAASVEGLELSARRSWPVGLELSLAYTLQHTRNDGPSPTYNGNRLPYEPKHALFLRAGWERGRYRLWHEFHYQGETYRDRANLEENLSPESSVHNIGCGLELVPGALSVSVEVQNVTDERLTDVEGYPLPGRTFYATLVFGGASR